MLGYPFPLCVCGNGGVFLSKSQAVPVPHPPAVFQKPDTTWKFYFTVLLLEVSQPSSLSSRLHYAGLPAMGHWWPCTVTSEFPSLCPTCSEFPTWSGLRLNLSENFLSSGHSDSSVRLVQTLDFAVWNRMAAKTADEGEERSDHCRPCRLHFNIDNSGFF